MVTIWTIWRFQNDLGQICKILREKYGYDNCKLVSDRNYDSLVRDPDIRVTDRSFYFREKSHVIVFIFFCDKRDKSKIFHGESTAAELTHLLTCLKNKVKCCFILREKGCRISPVLFGDVKKNVDMMHDTSNFKNRDEIASLIQARFTRFLIDKYSEIM